jgi:hypothetical protein
MGIGALTLAGGPALGLIQVAFANPAQANVMSLPPGSATGGFMSVATVTTVLPAVALFVPLLIIGLLVFGAANTALIKTQSRPALFDLPAARALARVRSTAAALSVPEQYRSIFNPRALEMAVAGGRPLLWLASLVALAFAVTR